MTTSNIDPTKPTTGQATTESVRLNFQASKDEIEQLFAEKLDLAGGTITGALTVQGAFTSRGIDDNATGERFQVADSGALFGTTGADYTIGHSQTDRLLVLTGGPDSANGANVLLYGDTHATRANDIDFRASNGVFLRWDESGGRLALYTGTGDKTQAAKYETDHLSLGVAGSRYRISQNDDTTSLIISGGSDQSNGGELLMYGGTHVSQAGDFYLRSSGNNVFTWDESAGQAVLYSGVGAKTAALTIDSSQDITAAGSLDILTDTNKSLRIRPLVLDNYANEGVGILMSRTTTDDSLMALGVVNTDKLGLFSREGIQMYVGGGINYSTVDTLALEIDGSGNVSIGSGNLDVSGTIYLGVNNHSLFGISSSQLGCKSNNLSGTDIQLRTSDNVNRGSVSANSSGEIGFKDSANAWVLKGYNGGNVDITGDLDVSGNITSPAIKGQSNDLRFQIGSIDYIRVNGINERVDITKPVIMTETIETQDKVKMLNLPTSASGLSAGDLWNDAGTLKIA